MVVDERSDLTAFVLLTIAPFMGLAYIEFLPLVGVGVLFAVLGMGLHALFRTRRRFGTV